MRGTVYVGTSLHNIKRANEIQQRFRNEGCLITYDWTTHGQVYSEEDLKRIAVKEENGVKAADVFFMVFPARNGTHWEGGLARGLQLCGQKIEIVILVEEEQEKKTFHYLDNVHKFADEDAAIQHALDFIDRKHNK